MARKPREFEAVDAVDEEDAEPTEGRGRSARKRASHELTKLGEELVALRAAQLAALDAAGAAAQKPSPRRGG